MTIEEFLKLPMVVPSISVIVTAVFTLFGIDYIRTKWTNKATIKDIGKITEIVEEIKSNLSKDTEILKAQLSFSNQHKTNIKSAERDALIEYNKRLSAWYYFMKSIDFSSFDVENYKEILFIKQEIKKKEYDFNLAEAHLLVFKNNIDFIELKNELRKYLQGYMEMVLRYSRKFHYNFTKFSLEVSLSNKAAAWRKLLNDNEELKKKYINDEEERANPLQSAQISCIKEIHNQIKGLYLI